MIANARRLVVLLILLIGCHRAPPDRVAPIGAHNAAAYFLYRCLHERGFQGRHVKSCAYAQTPDYEKH